MLTHISFQIRTIPVREDRLMPLPMHNNIYELKLSYQRKNVVGKLREFGVNRISNSDCVFAWNFLSSQKFKP